MRWKRSARTIRLANNVNLFIRDVRVIQLYAESVRTKVARTCTSPSGCGRRSSSAQRSGRTNSNFPTRLQLNRFDEVPPFTRFPAFIKFRNAVLNDIIIGIDSMDCLLGIGGIVDLVGRHGNPWAQSVPYGCRVEMRVRRVAMFRASFLIGVGGLVLKLSWLLVFLIIVVYIACSGTSSAPVPV
jgi:hypothetical protein